MSKFHPLSDDERKAAKASHREAQEEGKKLKEEEAALGKRLNEHHARSCLANQQMLRAFGFSKAQTRMLLRAHTHPKGYVGPTTAQQLITRETLFSAGYLFWAQHPDNPHANTARISEEGRRAAALLLEKYPELKEIK